MADPKRFKFNGDDYYIKSAAEMRELWEDRNGLKEACDNTLLIAERCDVEFTEGNGTYMPQFPCPEGETRTTWFVRRSSGGWPSRYPGGVTDEVRARMEFEIGVIMSMGFPGYFLVVADFINWAKEQRHPGRSRAVAPAPGRSWPTPCGSPTSTRSSTA